MTMPCSPSEQRPPSLDLAPPYASRDFTRFLEVHRMAVLDVVRGAAPDTRRLLVGDPSSGTVAYVVAVSHVTGAVNPVDNEESVLRASAEKVRPSIRKTMPQVVERLDVFTTVNGLVVTAVPGLRVVAGQRPVRTARGRLEAMPIWFLAVWEDTADVTGPVDLGASALSVLVSRHPRALRPEPALEVIRRARARLGEYEMPRTLVHGCLCPRHVLTEGSRAVGVEDWGLSNRSSSPLRDLGRFAVHLAGSRLPEVVAGRTSYAATVRQLVCSVLDATPLPRPLWRDLLVLTQLELAIESFDRSDPSEMFQLSRAVRAVPATLKRTR